MMGFLTDDDVNKRTRNLFVAFENAAPLPPAGIEIVSTLGAMQFAAQYLAFNPAVVGIGGIWNAAQTGVNGILTAGDTIVDFSGTGTSVGTVNSTVGSSCCEFVIGSFLTVGFYVNGLAPPYNANAFAGNSGSFSSYYQYDGTIVSFVGGSVGNPTFGPGDVVGALYSSGTGQVTFFLNGVVISSVGSSNNDMRPMATRS